MSNSWMIWKGIPCTKSLITNAVFSCYNFLISSLTDDGHQDASVSWYNREVYTCFHKVLAILDNTEFIIPKTDCMHINCNDVTLLVEKVVTHHGLNCDIRHALESLMLCTAVIWKLKTTENLGTVDQNYTKICNAMSICSFDCVTVDGERCRAAQHLGISFLKKVFDATEKDRGQQLDTPFQYHIYGVAYTYYKQSDSKSCLDVLYAFLQKSESYLDNLQQLNLAKIYNLIGCCLVNLKQCHTSIVYFRKAMLCQDNSFACHLYNAALVYIELGKTDTASQAMDILVSSMRVERPKRLLGRMLVFRPNGSLEITAANDISHWGWPNTSLDYIGALYVAANTALLAGMFQKASDYYSRLILSQSRTIITLGITKTCVSLPTREQIWAEKQFASSGCYPSSEVDDAKQEFSDITSKLKYYALELEKTLIKLDINYCDSVLESIVINGKKLHHCICSALCFTKQFLENTEDGTLVEFSLQNWQPKVYSLPELGKADGDEKLIVSVSRTMKILNDAQGKFVLNKAILMSCVGENPVSCVGENPKSEIIRVAQSVLKFAPKDIQIRWKLTLLFWKLGYKSEACKTWLRTRGLDCRMGNKEISSLVTQRASASVPDNKKVLYQWDVAILKEVFRSRRRT